MKHKAAQFELPAIESAFNLAGETFHEPEARPQARPDNTREMFLDSTEIQRGRMTLANDLKFEL